MTTPEQALWRAVIALAVQDAIEGSTDAGQSKQTKITQTEHARAYLTKPSADLATVCALADLDATAVREAMTKRIAAAPAPGELFIDRRHRHKATIMLTHEGQTRDLNAWAKITGIAKHTLRNRIRRGWDAQRVLTTPAHIPSAAPKPKAQRTSTAKMLTHAGKTKTVAQWSKIIGIPAPVLHMRERSGWDDEKIITTPYTPRTNTARMGRPRGVVSDFGPALGTGGGTSLQDGPKINFSQDAQT